MPPTTTSPTAVRVQDLLHILNQELDPELGARISRADRPRDDRNLNDGGEGSGREGPGREGPNREGPGGETRLLSSGVGEIDTLIGGGFPRGALSEVSGPASSGRTTLGLALLSRLTRGGDYVAWIDAADAFDPLSAAEAGVVLDRVLWVRAPDPMAALRCCERVLETEGFGLVALDLSRRVLDAPAERPQSRRVLDAPVERPQSRRVLDAPAEPRRARSVRRNPSARIPEAAWLRLTRRVAGKQLPLLLLSDERLAGTRAALAIEMVPVTARFTGMPRLLEPLEIRASLKRVSPKRWTEASTSPVTPRSTEMKLVSLHRESHRECGDPRSRPG